MIINNSNHSLSMFQRIVKRLFDIVFSLLLLLLLLPLLMLFWILLSIFMRENGIFLQQRVGRGGLLFNIVKFKTMKNIPGRESTITSLDDIRITKIGYFFRQAKIDELPQLWNVLIGQMSFVWYRVGDILADSSNLIRHILLSSENRLGRLLRWQHSGLALEGLNKLIGFNSPDRLSIRDNKLHI